MKEYFGFIIGFTLIVSFAFIVFFIIPSINKVDLEQEATKILVFRNNKQNCSTLASMYLDYYPKKYSSQINAKWFNEIKSKFVPKCIDRNILSNIEFIEVCSDFDYINCALSKKENPKLYENFNFKREVLKEIKKDV